LSNNPELGKPLVGRLSGLWSLRVGNYRAIYSIKNNELLVLVLRLGHRKNVYD
jgi:mRNA interferase RelE/StbE